VLQISPNSPARWYWLRTVNEIHLACAALRPHRPELLPANLEGADFLLLDGGMPGPPAEARLHRQLQQAVKQLGPQLYLDAKLRVVTTVGGGDSLHAARVVAQQLTASGNSDLLLAVVRGGDMLDRIEEFIAAGAELQDMATGQPIASIAKPIEVVTAWLGHEPIVASLRQHARVVVTSFASPGESVAGIAAAEFGNAIAQDARQARVMSAGELLASHAGRIDSPRAASSPYNLLALSGDGESRWVACDSHSRQQGDIAAPEKMPQPPEGQTLLSLIYRDGYLGTAMLEARGAEAAQELRAAASDWEQRLASERLLNGGAVSVEVFESLEAALTAVAIVRFQHDSAQRVEAALEILAWQSARWPAGPQLRPDLPQQAIATHGAWHTSVPSEWIEWTVDVKLAHEWVD